MTIKKIVRAREVMHDRYIEVDGLTTVADALIAMRPKNIDVAVIKKRDENDEYGIVVLADIAKKVLAMDRSPHRVNVYEIMSKPVVCLHAGMDVRYRARMFERFGLSVAPVVEDNKVIGMVGYKELVYKGVLVETGEV